jgi:uncharacterized protein (TIGR03067 family)
MTICRCVTLILITASLAFAPAPFARTARGPKTAPTSMEGEWLGGSRLLITATRLTYHPYESPVAYVLRVNTKVSPMTYDIRSVSKSEEAWDYQGIWRVEGDTLTLCYNGAAARGRPTSFDGPGKGTFTEVYRRVKK